jgi:hypothetical protein
MKTQVRATDICARALAEGHIRPQVITLTINLTITTMMEVTIDLVLLQTIRAVVGEIVTIREKLTGIINHDWVSVPLVYTQVSSSSKRKLKGGENGHCSTYDHQNALKSVESCKVVKYNQVVTLAVYSYFGAAVIGAQWVIPDNEQAYKVNHHHHHHFLDFL